MVMTEDEVKEALRRACEKAGNVRTWALANDVSPQYVGDVLNGNRKPGESILKPLGIEVVITYRRTRK